MARTTLRGTGKAESIQFGHGSRGKGNAGLEDDSGLEGEQLGGSWCRQPSRRTFQVDRDESEVSVQLLPGENEMLEDIFLLTAFTKMGASLGLQNWTLASGR